MLLFLKEFPPELPNDNINIVTKGFREVKNGHCVSCFGMIYNIKKLDGHVEVTVRE